jgi:bleomycin hydrolase
MRVLLFSGALLVAAPCFAGALDGKRLADKILFASDAERASASADAIGMAIRRHGIRRVALRADFVRAHNDRYTKELPTKKIRDQKSSGRCWIFSALNEIESDAHAQAPDQPQLKLSRSYINAKNLQAEAYALLKSGAKADMLNWTPPSDIGEGGHFAYAMQIVDKYGVVPEKIMRDTFDAKNSATLLKLLETIVVRAQNEMRPKAKNSVEQMEIVQRAQKEIDVAIARAFTGTDKLPDTFLYNGKEYTPKSYAEEHIKTKASDYVSFVDGRGARTGWQEWGEGTQRVHAYNTRNIEFMKQVVKNAIDQGKKVYFSAPVNAESAPFMINAEDMQGLAHAKGIMSTGAFDYATLGLPAPILDRETVQRTGLNNANHAMTIVGYELGADGKVIKWKVENSWGTDGGDKGIMHMYDDFFTSFVGMVTVPKSAVPAQIGKRLMDELKIKAAMNWDPT